MPLEEPFEVKVAKSENHQSNDDDDDDDGDGGDDDKTSEIILTTWCSWFLWSYRNKIKDIWYILIVKREQKLKKR